MTNTKLSEIATVQTSRDWRLDQKRARVIRAAVDWTYNQSCSSALMELEDAVVDLFGVPLDGPKVPYRSG